MATDPIQQFRIEGMDCAEEVAVLKREVGPIVGGEELLSFDILNSRMVVRASVTAQTVIAAVGRTGMRAALWTEESAPPEANQPFSRNLRTIVTASSGILLALGFLSHVVATSSFVSAIAEGGGDAHSVPTLSKMFYGLSALAGAWFFLPKAWYALSRLRPDMNLLMTIAVVGAIGIGEWSEAATVAFLFSISLALESWSVGRARKAIGALLNLAPPTARVKDAAGKEAEMPAEQVPVGSIFVVKPGERIALDGRVFKGESHVNQAPITGESMPALKQPSADVFAGTINGDGLLEIESTKAAQDTTLARIIRMVGEAQSRRAPSEQWVDRFARIYTPAVMAAAFLVLIVPPLVFGAGWQLWLYNALVLLVIACPCALVISTPVSIVAALAAAAKQGVLIKGGAFVEGPARLKAIAFDKTGTITAGRPAVVELVPLSGHDEKELLERAAAMELRSDHPLAIAIVAYAELKGVRPVPAEDFQILQGRGATARFDGTQYWLGSHRYLEERGQETPEIHERLEKMSGAGRTVVVIGNDKHVCGLIALADEVRPEARSLLQELRNAGILKTIMLTGDNEATASAVAKEVGIDEFRAELLPQDKVQAIEELVAMYKAVGMVGDGVNDAPALGRATIGIAMGAAGSDAAIETADIALMSDDLSKLPWIIRHSHRTLRIIRQNISFALAVKALFVVMTFAGAASLWSAIAADTGASLLVVFNGLRLLGPAPRRQ